MVFRFSPDPSKRQDVQHPEPWSGDASTDLAEKKITYSNPTLSFDREGPQTTTAGWRPYTMRAPVLVPFILVSLFLAAIIELLAQKSKREGGLSLSPDPDESPAVIFYSRYAPTIVAVVYSLWWTWIDLDIRRMQPWLDLSRPAGAPAESTLFLDYPFEFLAFIPYRAGKRKHWLVFLAGTIMMVIFWAITPLQSAVFGIQPVILKEHELMGESAQLANLSQQLDAMDASILNDAYATTWLGQPLPKFTTSQHVFLPLRPVKKRESSLPDETWTTTATALSTELECWPAIVDKTELQNTFEFDNGQGCKANISLFSSSRADMNSSVGYSVIYVGYHMEAHLDWFLQGPDCSQEASHQFLAVWGRRPKDSNVEAVTGLFCEPHYWKQNVSVTISARDQRPIESSVVPVDRLERLEETEFNATAFEYLLGTGVSPKEFRRDYPRDRVPDQYAALFKTNIIWPVTNMVGFAVGDMNYSLADLQSSAALHEVFSNAHKKLFSTAIPAMLNAAEHLASERSGTIQYTLYGIVVSRPIALTLEILHILVGVLVGVVLVSSSQARSNLIKDPTGIGSLLGIFRESDSLLKDYASKDRYDETTLRKSAHEYRYGLVRHDTLRGSSLRIELSTSVTSDDPNRDTVKDEACHPTRHTALQPLSGVVFVGSLVAGMVVLLYLKRKEQLLGGLPRPTENFEVLQLLENYVPTVFATLVEPFLVLLNRLRCILQPFHDLRKGNKSAEKTLETPYTSLPPQFTLWNALKSGHLMLASLCALSLLANIFAVALGAIFNELPIAAGYPTALRQTQLPVWGRSIFIDTPHIPQDHFYVTKANLSLGTRLPAWTDPKFGYLPFAELAQKDDNSSSTYRAQTRGFGVEFNCSRLSTSPDSNPYVNYTLQDDGLQDLVVRYATENGSIAHCSTFKGIKGTPALNISLGAAPGYLALELVTPLVPLQVLNKDKSRSEVTEDWDMCKRKLLLSWWRVDPTDRNASLSAVHLQCVPVFQTAVFDVVVDSSGYVLESARVGDFDNISSLDWDQTQDLLADGVNIIGQGASIASDSTSLSRADASWHNDTLTRDWVNYLLKVAMNTSRLVDPDEAVPDPASIIVAVQDLYQRFFSNLLGRDPTLFKTATAPVEITGTRTVLETRIFMDQTAFVITIIILCLNIIVATMLYIQERKPFLPRLPATIGSILAYVAASTAVREYVEPGERRINAGRRRPVVSTYGFGKYVGVDGKNHVGIEAHPFVVPLDWETKLSSKEPFSLRKWFRRFGHPRRHFALGKR
ncbi:hypothetical protein QBC33DRAFT_542093 [Phialemonium atrogriseum]|uniref:Uncharacterized protein n=1 Tax=Phialemonium atrogriseum TaxID=1093897 RepID=A0AAJ0FG39_9PEZI|nr:uncharacterized protein QBC33DRAFT_542093 [Phialemonium atrogriseum]KAK1766182.1 hypothetical protein QBC33DRAFT_542093 [Phialemonium atrogriseum]